MASSQRSFPQSKFFPLPNLRRRCDNLFFADRAPSNRAFLQSRRLFQSRGGFFSRPFVSRPTAYPRRRCFRCLKVGHLARACRSQIVCWRCGGSGHKKASCIPSSSPPDLVVPKVLGKDALQQILLKLGSLFLPWPAKEALDEFSSRFRALIDFIEGGRAGSSGEVSNQFHDTLPESRVAVSLDPEGWSPARNSQAEEFISDSQGAQASKGDVVCSQDSNFSGPLIEEVCYSPIPFKASDSGIHLEFSPVPLDSFADFFIIDEFEDFYSDEEDDSPASIIQRLEENKGQDNVEDSFSMGKEIWGLMDQPKFLYYCCFQAVDGFARLMDQPKFLVYSCFMDQSGSDVLSPFKPKPMKKPDLSPLKDEHEMSLVKCKSASPKRSCKTNKRGLGPIMLCTVRRSPRSASRNSRCSPKLDSPASVRRSPRLSRSSFK